MKIFNSAQIRELDKYTIEHEPIASLDLMERAAKAIAQTIMQRWTKSSPFVVFAGPGNNGGDALAVARLLAVLSAFICSIFTITFLMIVRRTNNGLLIANALRILMR